MSTLEIILTRAMSDAEFADQLFADTEKALAEYSLSAGEIAKFKGISRTEFEALATEDRKSMIGIFKISAAPR